MDKNIAIEFDGVGKQYRLGLVGTGSLQHDINRWWQTSILGKEDPYLKIGEVNDRSTKGHSDYVWALKDISFKVEQGDVVGIIGKNGAGKSTLLKLLSHITAPTTGHITYRGRIASLLEVGTGFHPEMTARDNIYMNGSIMGMGKHEIDRKLDEIVDFAGIERYIDTPVKRFSSGMTVRLGFAVAAFLEPEILVVDEVLAVGDAEFQKKAIGKMQEVSQGGGRTVLFVSHNMESIKSLCNTGILLTNGLLQYRGDIQSTINRYINLGAGDRKYKTFFQEDKNSYFNFLSIEVLANGKPVEGLVDVFDTLSFRIRYKLTRDDSGNCVYFILRKEGMVLAFLIDTTRHRSLITERKQGEYEMFFDLPTPLLKPGEYTVDLKYTRPRIIDIQYKEQCLNFEVMLQSIKEYDAGFAKNRDGVIAIDPEIKIKRI
ncbi:MAG: ATP-binding cassette domain-containing protein [Prevotella sp.]|nr:ATP-binding cassette domain-containing protein [Prevotella sp.]